MITQEYIDNELTLAKKLFLYYTDKMVDYFDAQNYVLSKDQKDNLWACFLESDYKRIDLFVDSIIRYEHFRLKSLRGKSQF